MCPPTHLKISYQTLLPKLHLQNKWSSTSRILRHQIQLNVNSSNTTPLLLKFPRVGSVLRINCQENLNLLQCKVCPNSSRPLPEGEFSHKAMYNDFTKKTFEGSITQFHLPLFVVVLHNLISHNVVVFVWFLLNISSNQLHIQSMNLATTIWWQLYSDHFDFIVFFFLKKLILSYY